MTEMEETVVEYMENHGMDLMEMFPECSHEAEVQRYLKQYRLIDTTTDDGGHDYEYEYEDKNRAASPTNVPKFYTPRSALSQIPFISSFYRHARTLYLEKRAAQLLSETQLANAWNIALKRTTNESTANHTSPPVSSALLGALPPLPGIKSTSQMPDRTSTQSSLPLWLNDIPNPLLKYEDFLAMSASLTTAQRRRYFSPRIFSHFEMDHIGRISGRLFFRWLLLRHSLTRIRISLSCYDEDGVQYLTEPQFENYIFDQIPYIPALSGLSEDFCRFYAYIAARKFCFFLGSNKRGRLPIHLLTQSSIMHEFDQLSNKMFNSTPENDSIPALHLAQLSLLSEFSSFPLIHTPSPNLSTATSPAVLERIENMNSSYLTNLSSSTGSLDRKALQWSIANGWFSASLSQSLYYLFLELDANANGFLSVEELVMFPHHSFTPQFIDALYAGKRMFMNVETNVLEMDVKGFFDFALCLTYPLEKQSMEYFFSILDIDGKGILDEWCIRYWFQTVADQLNKVGYSNALYALPTIYNELADMVIPKNRDAGLSLEDLCRSGCGHLVIAILIDSAAFWKYDNKEAMLQEQQSQQQQQQQL